MAALSRLRSGFWVQLMSFNEFLFVNGLDEARFDDNISAIKHSLTTAPLVSEMCYETCSR